MDYDSNLSITHRLSGCLPSGDSSTGVVFDHGGVYDGAKPAGSTDTLPGLLIVDASVIPGAIVAHPSMTLIAQAMTTIDAAAAPGA